MKNVRKSRINLLRTIPSLRLTFDLFTLLLVVIFLGLLTINIHNRSVISDMLIGRALSGVGYDAPLIAPLLIALTALGINYIHARQKVSTLWWVSVALVLAGVIMWGVGLDFALRNVLQPQ